MGIVYGRTPSVVSGGLQLNLDAADKKSYPGSGNIWYDLSGNNRHAVIFGNSGFSSENGGKFKFPTPQATDYISLPASALRSTGAEYTIEFWMQPLTTRTGYFHSVSNDTDHNYMLMYHSTDGNIRFNAGGTNIPYSNNEMLQLCIVRSSSDTGTLYKDGYLSYPSSFVTQVNAAVDNGWILNQESDSLGGNFDANQNYLGSFMIVRVYNRALSSNEIIQNFHAVRARYGA